MKRKMNHMNEPESIGKLLTVAEVAEVLAIKPATVRSWILKQQKLEVVRVGRCVRVTERSVRKLIDDNTISPAR